MSSDRYYGHGIDIQDVAVYASRLIKKYPDLDHLTAISLAVEIQRNEIIREALYLFDDGDGPVLIEMAHAFSTIAKNIERVANAVSDLSHSVNLIADSISDNEDI